MTGLILAFSLVAYGLGAGYGARSFLMALTYLAVWFVGYVNGHADGWNAQKN